MKFFTDISTKATKRSGKALTVFTKAPKSFEKSSHATGKALNPMLQKLKSTCGFTIAEEILSIVFLGLLCIAISAGIGAALAAYGETSDIANANQLMSRSIQEINNELAYSVSAVDGGGQFTSSTTRTLVQLGNDGTNSGITMNGTNLGGTDISYVLFIPKVNGLVSYFTELPKYDAKSNSWSYTLQVKKDGTILKEQEMTVVRVMPSVL